MTPPELPQVQPLPEDWSRALCVVAHPDDLEYGVASAIARWTDQGKTITYLLATRGEAGINDLRPEDAAPLREAEEIAGAREVGVDVVEFLDHADGVIELGLPLRRDIARAIRHHRPEVIVGINHHERFGGGFTNQSDHRVVGLATIDAAKDAGNRWIFPELIDEGLQPWGGTRFVAIAGSPLPTHGTDVTGSLDRGVRSLRAHAAYLAGLGDAAPEPEEFLSMIAAGAGLALGVDYAVLFEVFDL
jgi:LmbE family N-acetylglucosaminyl deacetylase